ncbi:MAG TPA: MarR family transcriptional regulator [Sphingomicrobium sp.]
MPKPELPDLKSADVNKTVTLTEKDMQDAARLFRLLVDPAFLGNGETEADAPSAEPGMDASQRLPLTAKARDELSRRRARKRYFHRDIFGEPAWEILLALYVTDESGARLTISKLAEWIGVPLTTVVRWVKALEEELLVERVEHPTDRRIVFIRLLDQGRTALDSYLGAIG